MNARYENKYTAPAGFRDPEFLYPVRTRLLLTGDQDGAIGAFELAPRAEERYPESASRSKLMHGWLAQRSASNGKAAGNATGNHLPQRNVGEEEGRRNSDPSALTLTGWVRFCVGRLMLFQQTFDPGISTARGRPLM